MNIHGKGIKVFSGNSNKEMASEIARRLNVNLGEMRVGRFNDGEVSVDIGEVVRGCDVYVVQSTCSPVNENLVELLVILDAMKRASAGRAIAVIPYFGYARQDRKAKARDPISAKLVANLITVAGADRILTMDLHTPQIQGFFDIPVDHLLGARILAQHFSYILADRARSVAVSPDAGSANHTRLFAEYLDIPIAIGDKRRTSPGECDIVGIIGDVAGKDCVIFDDMIDTGGTLVQTAEKLVSLGASKVYATCTHGVFSGNSINKIDSSCIEKLVTLNTIPLPKQKHIPKIEQLSVSYFFAEAIERIYGDKSVSMLFSTPYSMAAAAANAAGAIE